MGNNAEKRASVAVFCASNRNVPAEYINLAEQFGNLLAKSGYDLVWGGCDFSAMGALARGAQASGGHVFGVIPQSMVTRGLAYKNADGMFVVQDLGERKKIMRDKSDAFVVLPGGVGTLDEFFDVFSSQVLLFKEKQATKLVVLLNHQGYYDPLINLLEGFYSAGMADAGYRGLYDIASFPEEVIEKLRRVRA